MESVCDAGGGDRHYNSDCYLAIIIGSTELWNYGTISVHGSRFKVNGE